MEELKPCPFCDCEMEIASVGRDWWRIKPVDGHEDACPFGEFHEWDCSQQKPEWKEEHIADWNKRTDDRLVEENAELRDSESKLVNETEDLKCRVEDLREAISLLIRTSSNVADTINCTDDERIKYMASMTKANKLLNK